MTIPEKSKAGLKQQDLLHDAIRIHGAIGCASSSNGRSSAAGPSRTEFVQQHFVLPWTKRHSYSGWEESERSRPGFEGCAEPDGRADAADHRQRKGNMPPFNGRLSDAQINSLAAYIHTFSGKRK
jgi:hypothetical protein